MAKYTSQQIKNIALFGHAGSGKTSLAETMLFESGSIKRRGSVEEGNTVSDHHPLEKEKGSSIFGSLLNLDWRNYKINIIDTPGFDDFVGEVIAALRVVDTGIMLLHASNGVEVGTELIWENTRRYKTPMLFAVNQLDADKADFDRTVEQAKNRFGEKVTVVQFPVNQGSEFSQIVDVLKMVMYEFPPEGGKPEKKEIPSEHLARAKALHNALVETAAENDEALMEKYFEKGSLDEDEMRRGLKLGLINHDIFPLFCLSAKRNMGSGRLMGFIDNVCPSAAEMPPEQLEDDKLLPIDAKADPSAFIFKTASEPHLGEMSFGKVCSGTIKQGDELVNLSTGSEERLSQLYFCNGKERKPAEEVVAGDLFVAVKLKGTKTNNTLGLKDSQALQRIQFPKPKVRRAIVSQNQGDEEKIAVGLNQLKSEDPTLQVDYSKELKQTILKGQGEIHLKTVQWKLENHFKAKVDFERPKVPYRETIQKMAEASYRHKKQSGGSGQFAELAMRIEPYVKEGPDPNALSVKSRQLVELPWGGHLEFLWCIVGGSIDNKYQNAILKGIMEKMEDGPLLGSYVRDVRVAIFDGKMHSVDSNDMAFKLAAAQAFKNAFAQADPKLMEPIHKLDILVPEEMMGDVMSDLQTRRGIIQGMGTEGHYQKIEAKAPLMELYQYSSTLRSLTQGRAKFNLEFDHYATSPFEIQNQLVSSRAALEEA